MTAATRRRSAGVLPARLSVLLGVFCYRSLTAALLGLPLGLGVAELTGHHPRGDEVLWDSGGVMLLEIGRRLGPLGAAQLGTLPLGLLIAFGALLPTGVLIASLQPRPSHDGASGPAPEPKESWRSLLSRAGAAFGTLSLLLGATLLVQALSLVFFTAVGGQLGPGLRLSTFGRDLVNLGALLLGLLSAWVWSVVQDAARVAAIGHDERLLPALTRALELLAARPWQLLCAGGWRTLLAALILATAGWLGLTHSSRQGDVVTIVAIHHAAVFAVIAIRASWYRLLSRWLLPSEAAPEAV